MSTTVKAGWLKDSQGNKFAPKTLVSQIYNGDGSSFEDYIEEIVKNVDIDVDSEFSLTSANPVQNKVVSEAINNLNALVGDTNVSEQIAAAIDAMELITIEDIDAICGANIRYASEVTF